MMNEEQHENARFNEPMKQKNDLLFEGLNQLLIRLIQVDDFSKKNIQQLVNELEDVLQKFETNGDVSADVGKAVATLKQAVKDRKDRRQKWISRAGEILQHVVEKLEGSISRGNDEGSLYVDGDEESNSRGASNEYFCTLPDDVDVSLLKEYIDECYEYLDAAESALLKLESEPEDEESINTVFRTFHTIKGTSSFIGLQLTADFAHTAETFLDLFRQGKLHCIGRNADLALQAVDMMKELTHGVKGALNGGAIVKPDGYDQLMAALARADADYQVLASMPLTDSQTNETAEAQKDYPPGLNASQSDDRQGRNGLKDVRADTDTKSFVRVRTDRLDTLIDLVGEMVIAFSLIAQDPVVNRHENYDLLRKVNHAGKILRDFQDLSLSLRMIPLRSTFKIMERLTRDLAHKSGKKVRFIMQGEDTEIDRNMVELIKDPLIHIIRNAIDHGIEDVGERREKGKDETGTLRISAYHSGGNVIVDIADDGKGLDKNKILAVAVSKGLVDNRTGLSDQEIYQLIFSPGFSTSDSVSDVSGRGVGLDVVKKNIEALNGNIDIHSTDGRGCTFTLRIPLTLAITDGMLVEVGREKYIIPTMSINMTLRPERNSLSTIAGVGEVLKLRDKLVPIFRLYKIFDVKDAVTNIEDGLLIVIEDGKRRCALLVDGLVGKRQVVVKSLTVGGKKISGIAGAAILGDGRVGLIIDTPELVDLARSIVEHGDSMTHLGFAA